MAQPVSQNFLEILADPERDIVERVELFRRIKDTDTIEATPLIFKENEIKSITNISRKFDTKFQNRILLSGVTLSMRDEDWKWIETNITFGIWRPTALVPAGFDPYLSEVIIKQGFKLDDGSIELVTVFTGVLLDILVPTTKNKLVNLPLIGKPEVKLRDTDAQDVATLFITEPTVPPTGDGSNNIFAMKKSVWEASQVRTAAAVKLQGSGADYQLRSMNNADDEAEIVFNTGKEPGNGEAVDYNGRQWLRDKKVGELVEAICDKAGIDPADRTIIEPEFPDIAQFVEVTDQADFEAGSVLQNINTKEIVGSIQGPWLLVDNFDDFNFSVNPPWNALIGPTDNADASTGKLNLVVPGFNDAHVLATSQSNSRSGVNFSAYGAWIFKLTKGSGLGNFQFIKESFVVFAPGYAIEYNPDGKAYFVNNNGADPGSKFINLGTIPNGETTWAITRRITDNQFRIYKNGTLVGTFTEGSVVVSVAMALGGTGPFSITVDDIFFAPTLDPDNINISGKFVTAVIDLLAPPTSWSNFIAEEILNGGTAAYATAVADLAGGPFDAFVQVVNGEVITSNFKQFLKMRAILVSGNTFSDPTLQPIVASLKANFAGSELFVAHADFSGKGGDAAIKRLGEITNSEFGSTGPGKYFFRPKTVGLTPVMTLDPTNFIKEVRGFKTGFDRVKNRVGVFYPPYFDERTSATEGDASEDRFKKRVLSKTISDFAFSNNANFSVAIAKVLRQPFPKRRGQLVCRLIVHLDQSDVIRASWWESPFEENSIFGDPQNPEPIFGTPQNVLFRDVLFKIIGIDINRDAKETIFDVEEILI